MRYISGRLPGMLAYAVLAMSMSLRADTGGGTQATSFAVSFNMSEDLLSAPAPPPNTYALLTGSLGMLIVLACNRGHDDEEL